MAGFGEQPLGQLLVLRCSCLIHVLLSSSPACHLLVGGGAQANPHKERETAVAWKLA